MEFTTSFRFRGWVLDGVCVTAEDAELLFTTIETSEVTEGTEASEEKKRILVDKRKLPEYVVELVVCVFFTRFECSFSALRSTL